jgi:serine/threonine-protein kinase
VWALGATLHELLCGSAPFQAESSSALLAAIVADSPAPITSLCNDLPRALESVVLRCLSKEPHARYPSVADLALALRPFATPDAQAAVERIARIQSLDTRQSPLLSPSRAIVRVGPSPALSVPPAAAHEAAALVAQSPQPSSAARWLALQLIGSAALAAVGVLGGTIAGAVVARRAVSDAAVVAARPGPSAPRVTSAPPTTALPAVAQTAPSAPLPAAVLPAATPASAPPVRFVTRRRSAAPSAKRPSAVSARASESAAGAEKAPGPDTSKEHLFDRMW